MGTVFSSAEEEEDELEQEPEVPPFDHSSSPLSPQISMSRSPFFGPALRNSDPYNAITPVSLSPTNAHVMHLSRFHNVGATISPSPFLPSWLLSGEEFLAEVYLIRHAQSTLNLRPELIGGRSPSSTLTENGKQEARALGLFLRSTGVVFDAVYCSPLERAKQTAVSVCQALRIPEEQLEILDALQELSQGQWEGCVRSEVYSREIVQLMNNTQPDFRAPGGESQRQVEFRMVEFLNNIILPHAVIAMQDEAKLEKEKGFENPNLAMQVHPLEEVEVTSAKEPTVEEPKIILAKEAKVEELKITSTQELKSLAPIKITDNDVKQLEHKSSSNGDNSHQQEDGSQMDHFSQMRNHNSSLLRRERESPLKRGPYRVAVFSHGMAIKCVLRGLLGSDPYRTQQICIDNTSVSVLKYAGSTGWQVQRVNDTSHLRLL